MLKKDYINKIAEMSGLTKVKVAEVLDAVGEVVFNAIAEEDSVPVFDGMKVYGVTVAESVRRNPRTGEPVTIPAHMAPRAKFLGSFKNAVKESVEV